MERVYIEVIATKEAERNYIQKLVTNAKLSDAIDWIAMDKNHIRAMLKANGIGLLVGYALLKKFGHAARIYAIKGDVIYPRDMTDEFLQFAEKVTSEKGLKRGTWKKEEIKELNKLRKKPLEVLLNRRVI
ncbi:hypothetical protein DRP05_14360 [Archaeoglobales archaeon]|nr:MAG: hypothetical protein DRP05_14360 [Archaeoglobales archaeon]